MQFVTKAHAALRVIQGSKEPSRKEDVNVRLRAEQSIGAPHKLTPEEVKALRDLADQSRQ